MICFPLKKKNCLLSVSEERTFHFKVTMQLYGRWSVLMLVIGIASIFITPVFIWEKVQQRQCVTNLSNYANNTHQLIRREIHHFSDYHDYTDNVWWQLMHQTVRKIRNDSCYVCCLIPHAINDQPFLVPVPIVTALTEEGFTVLTKEQQVIRTMSLQN
ncbi:hypothetical protein ILYODFUR_029020 [Ilyodon furcidens]|uniref:Uncharacterized protein n=1 Tax=Ilyodon furcidens TaxID=33524 RepID=A0ABV0U2B2_9TELE